MLYTSVIALFFGLAGGLAAGLVSRLAESRSRPLSANPRLAIRATNIALVDEQGRERVVVKLVDGRPVLVFSDEHRLPSGDVVSTSRLAIGILHDGTPSLEIADSNGRQRASLAVTAGGSALLELMAKNGKAHISMSVGADGPSALTFFDEMGSQTIKWP
ncbi:MAG TPA: hypothetical protein VGY99_03130 [Candidatus Binataceae bacterium]|nr:hypothetical protein [Candidatus Binataceae bacterium]